MCFLRKLATFLSTLFLMNTSGKLLVEKQSPDNFRASIYKNTFQQLLLHEIMKLEITEKTGKQIDPFLVKQTAFIIQRN